MVGRVGWLCKVVMVGKEHAYDLLLYSLFYDISSDRVGTDRNRHHFFSRIFFPSSITYIVYNFYVWYNNYYVVIVTFIYYIFNTYIFLASVGTDIF